MRSGTLLLVSAIGFVVLYIASGLALGVTPGPEAGGAEVAAFFATHGTNVRTFVWLSTVMIPLAATYSALVRARLPGPHRDVFFVGAVALGAETAVSTWFWAGLSWHGADLEPSVARALLDVTSFWGPVLNGVTITMLAPVVTLSWGSRAALPRWLGVLGGIALLEQTCETVTIFGQTGFLAPGGPMNLLLGAGLVALWLLCLGITLSRRPAFAAPARSPVTGG